MLVRLPLVAANEDSATLVRWRKNSGELVRSGESVCDVETTKAVVEIEAPGDGYLRQIAPAGNSVRVGEPLAALTLTADEDLAPLLTPPAATAPEPTRRWTRKAEIMARRMQVDLEKLAAKHPGAVVGEAEVLAAGKESPSDVDRVERVLVLGGAFGGGAALVLDALTRIPGKRAVGVLDRDPAGHGNAILGIPVLGPMSQAEELLEKGFYDSAVIAFNANLGERAALFEKLAARGIPFTNVVDVTADVRLNARLGTGNVILAWCHIGPFASLGDNNFLSTSCCIEHHCRLGSHCAFGPHVAFSGRVTVGNRVRFGMMIGIEPDVTIGDEAVIASGSILTRNIPDRTTVKMHPNYSLRLRQEDSNQGGRPESH
jgi:sugar O-acyltransferase (sialic acid O-acetyltransferase NeuD family)